MGDIQELSSEDGTPVDPKDSSLLNRINKAEAEKPAIPELTAEEEAEVAMLFEEAVVDMTFDEAVVDMLLGEAEAFAAAFDLMQGEMDASAYIEALQMAEYEEKAQIAAFEEKTKGMTNEEIDAMLEAELVAELKEFFGEEAVNVFYEEEVEDKAAPQEKTDEVQQ